MKNFARLSLIALVLMMGTGLFAQKIASDKIIANWNLALKAETVESDFVSFVNDVYIPALEKNMPGVKSFLLKGERGINKDAYIMIAVFESVDARNAYWPQEGTASEKAKEVMEKMSSEIEKLWSMAEMESFTDWIVL